MSLLIACCLLYDKIKIERLMNQQPVIKTSPKSMPFKQNLYKISRGPLVFITSWSHRINLGQLKEQQAEAKINSLCSKEPLINPSEYCKNIWKILSS